MDNSGNNSPVASDGAVYKGLAIATARHPIFAGDANSTTVLYAANFHSGQIEVYDTDFNPVTLPAGAFTDPNLPKGYAPFNVQVLGGKVYVTYAKQDDDKHDDVAGPGHGFVDVFNLDGTPGLASGKCAWSRAARSTRRGAWPSRRRASADLGGDLLVGNFGDGHINAFNATTGAFLGELKDPDGEPIADRRAVGAEGRQRRQRRRRRTRSTSPPASFDETHGLFGSLTPVAPAAGAAPAPSGSRTTTPASPRSTTSRAPTTRRSRSTRWW